MSDGEVSDDDNWVFGTQDNREVFTNIRDRFGHLPKEDFRENLVKFKESDLSVFRESLYGVARKEIPDTPEATLVTRKAQGSGPSLKTKLSDDIFTLYHYIQGDLSVDLYKLFPDRERARLRSSKNIPKSTSGVQNSDLGSESEADDVDLSKTMLAFCRDFLTEMRINRDELTSDIKEIKRDTSLIRGLSAEFVEMKRDLESLKGKMVILEKELQTKATQMDKTSDKCRQLEMRLDQMCSQQTEQQSKIHENTTVITSRPKTVDKSSVLRHSSVAGPTGGTSSSDPSGSRPQESSSSDLPVWPSKKSTVIVTNKIGEVAQHSTNASNTRPQATKTRVLAGFVPRDQRPKLGAIYVAGIIADDDDDSSTIASVEKYVKDKGKYVRSVRVVKHKGNTAAIKLIVRCDDVGDVTKEKFWPAGVHVRQWIDRDSEK